MDLSIGYGNTIQKISIMDSNVIDVLMANSVKIREKGYEAVRKALGNPIGTGRLADIVKNKHRIVVITSDITRPMPTYAVMPLLLEEFLKAGVNLSEVTVVFAVGSHRDHTVEEMKHMVGEDVYSKVNCVDADGKDFVHMGTTTHGTPVDVTRIVAEADCRICLGNIEYHWFAGYSGGAKAIMPGVSSRAAIQVNHSLLTDNASVVANVNSPVRADLEEAINYCPIDFIVNVVLNEHKEIIYAVAGHYIEAHRMGCHFLDRTYSKPIPELADIVVVSQGGMPKDLNLYQMQKALDNARHAVKEGGIIIWVGAAKEGLGEKVFEEWMLNAKSPKDILQGIKKDFRLGGHKAAGIALTLATAEIYLVSELDAALVRRIFMTPFEHTQLALEQAFKLKGKNARVMVMPYGGSTLPLLSN